MSATPRQLIERQIRRVNRRLFLCALLETVALFWTGALALCALWFLARPFVTSSRAEWMLWGIPAALVAGSTIAALVWSIIKRPPLVAAALALDEHFALKERITTYYLLSGDQADSGAGQALLSDIKEKACALDVASRFPIRLGWYKALLPVGAALVALAASFFDPSLGSARQQRAGNKQNEIDTNEVAQQIDLLKKAFDKEKDNELKSDKLKELDAEWEKLVKNPPDPSNEEQIRERVNEIRSLEDKTKERIDQLKNKAASKDLQKQLEKLGLDKLGKKMKEGPAKDFQDALSKGKLDKAREALEKLEKQLEQGKLSDEEKKQLIDQMKDLQEKLQRLADQKEEKDRLQKEFEQGKIDREQLDREMDRLAQEAAEMQDLQELADLLGECKECLGAGQSGRAGGKLKAMISRLREMELSEAELARLIKDMELLQGARCRMLGACANGMGEGRNPGGVRPIGEDPKSKVFDKRQAGESDPQGEQRITGFVKGGSFTKIPAREVGGAFKQAVQDAPEAIDRQRIPPDYADITRGYFEKLGGQK